MALIASWVNGTPASSISIQNRGLAYGDGVFETVLCCANTPLHWARHKARLRRGCDRLNLAVPNNLDAEIVMAMQTAVTGHAILKIMVVRAEPAAGYGYSSTASDVIVTLSSYQCEPPRNLDIGIATVSLGSNPQLAGIKHLSRLENTHAAAQAAREGLHDMLMLDGRQNVIEATNSNIFVKLHGKWQTPRLDTAGVAGVMRSYLLEEALPSRGIHCDEVVLPLSSLPHWEAAFVTNSLKGARPIGRINGRQLATDALTFLENINHQCVN